MEGTGWEYELVPQSTSGNWELRDTNTHASWSGPPGLLSGVTDARGIINCFPAVLSVKG